MTTTQDEARPGAGCALAPNERVVRHPNGHLMIEEVPPYIPTEAAIDKALASLAKAYPYLAEHASHIDGEFGNALTEMRRMVAAFRSALAAPPAPACDCASCRAARETRAPYSCCPQRLTHGAFCICGATIAEAPPAPAPAGEAEREDELVRVALRAWNNWPPNLPVMVFLDEDRRQHQDASAAGMRRVVRALASARRPGLAPAAGAAECCSCYERDAERCGLASSGNPDASECGCACHLFFPAPGAADARARELHSARLVIAVARSLVTEPPVSHDPTQWRALLLDRLRTEVTRHDAARRAAGEGR